MRGMFAGYLALCLAWLAVVVAISPTNPAIPFHFVWQALAMVALVIGAGMLVYEASKAK